MRPRTPPRPNGNGGTTIKVQRCCNGCGSQLGDVTEAEISAAVDGARLPDVTRECPLCRYRALLAGCALWPQHFYVEAEEMRWLIAQIDDARAEATR